MAHRYAANTILVLMARSIQYYKYTHVRSFTLVRCVCVFFCILVKITRNKKLNKYTSEIYVHVQVANTRGRVHVVDTIL